MRTHLAGVAALIVCLAARAGLADDPAAAPTPAERLWRQGQDALRNGRTDEAIQLFEQSLVLDPDLVSNHLSLAAAYLDKGDDERAGPHLARYLAARPEHCMVRAHYAELLLRRREVEAARRQYERFDADVQELEQLAKEELVHCHSRLMQIAEQEDDDFGVHLHRGIGLYALARQQELLGGDEQGLSTESLLCQAAAELTLAHRLRPGEARPCWYLFQVWSQLAQRQSAARWLRAADAAAPFSPLTPAERRKLALAARDLDAETHRK
jgi:tetratricopeptide (TPR) repeat protein